MVLTASVITAGSWRHQAEKEDVTGNDFRFDAATLKDTALWTKVNSSLYHISSQLDSLCSIPTAANFERERKEDPHAATDITVYVNNAGRTAMFTKESPSFPPGSVIVKQKVGRGLDERNKTLLYTIMRKREAGYNPTVGDWEFNVVNADGSTVEASGKIENCQGCHMKKASSDFVFRTYVTFK
jgi:hypothetical protein